MAPGVEHDDAWWDGFCELMEFTRRFCAHCRRITANVVELPMDYEPEGPGRLTERGPSLPFSARFSGRCADCGHAIEPGDMIRRTDGGFVCEGCS